MMRHFSPVARYSTIRSIISLASVMGWKLHRMDIKTVLLNGVFEEEVYMEQPKDFVFHDRETHICRKLSTGLSRHHTS